MTKAIVIYEIIRSQLPRVINVLKEIGYSVFYYPEFDLTFTVIATKDSPEIAGKASAINNSVLPDADAMQKFMMQ